MKFETLQHKRVIIYLLTISQHNILLTVYQSEHTDVSEIATFPLCHILIKKKYYFQQGKIKLEESEGCG